MTPFFDSLFSSFYNFASSLRTSDYSRWFGHALLPLRLAITQVALSGLATLHTQRLTGRQPERSILPAKRIIDCEGQLRAQASLQSLMHEIGIFHSNKNVAVPNKVHLRTSRS